MQRILTPEPLTKARFAPYGDVIETEGSDFFMINNGSTQRFHRLSEVMLGKPDDRAIISIFRAQKLTYPLPIKMLERHPLGSQAFIPLKQKPFLILVAEPGDHPAPETIRAFITNGHQGINYHTGVWHHPILSCEAEDDFLIVDREGDGNNCDEHYFTDDEMVLESGIPS
ncbi:ureidoglycolate lyase [Amphritea sp. 2_MG-2023]|jgi:ureidoglycolate lyase|uniref:ureidoglycolate lyase n=1 Tax=Amphritea TaxID=515417 RepID=UPI001C076F39|nr:MULTISPECIES: ureidoglycolate lyase [Amphritea]MBU2965329.1 ureidoglycolate lyase [Amphritea atlantica]MDO6419974.1 ureidoglycolate lyase [Amphritea sp. 2_MG-2023]MDX2422253.1 ureidoglycolate lyase [Amphritea sp.]